MVTRTVLGHDVQRVEDPALLTGEAQFLADRTVEGLLHAVFVRSAVAHGTVRTVDVSTARTMPGVVAAFVAADLDLPLAASVRPVLAADEVRFVGEPVAVLVAESFALGLDAAESVVVHIDPLPVVLDPRDERATVVGGRHHDDDEAFFGDDDIVVSATITHNRIAPVTMEPNGILVAPVADGIDVWVSTQGVFGVRSELASALGLDPSQVRVRAPWVGGGFGAKGGVYVEHIATASVAHRLQRPVRWVETRSENLVNMTHGRAQIHSLTVGASRDGRLGGLRVRAWADVGAYATRGTFIPLVTRMMSAGLYRWDRHDYSALTALTNTTPTGPYRGAGRPEAAALCERAVDLAAAELGMDPAEVRRRSFPSPEEFPWTTATGAVYDVGDYERALDEALRLIGYDAWRSTQRAQREDATAPLVGIGIGCYVEVSGRGSEFGSVAVEPDGSVTVVTGSVPHGQGHETVWAQIASATMGVPFESVRVVHSDTGRVDHGTGTFGSRSLQVAGSAVQQASAQVLEQARSLAAHLLEAAVDDVVVFDDGRLGVAGVPSKALAWASLAAAAPAPLASALDFAQDGTFPFGCHVFVVSVDRETGVVSIADHVAVDDCGTVISPKLAEGQVHGGLAQGIAQMLFEEVRYDADGNPLTATLADYAVPTAVELPMFSTAHTVTPTPRNPLGAKGIGESGTTGSVGAIWNAVCDALSPLGIRHVDPPFTPHRVWEAMRAAAATP